MSQADRYTRYERLKFDWPHPRVLRIRLDNGKMNTADHRMHRELAQIWIDVDADPEVNAVIVTGNDRVFSAGGDFAMVDDLLNDAQARARGWKEARAIVYNIINCNKPIISAMRGVAVGAGLVVGVLADISIATKDCRIIDGHTRLGVAAGDHAAIIWPLLVGMHRAKEYLMTGEPVLGPAAAAMGLVNRCVPDDALDAEVDAMAQKLRALPPYAVSRTKMALNLANRHMTGAACETSHAWELHSFTTQDFQEATRAFVEKRPGVYTGR